MALSKVEIVERTLEAFARSGVPDVEELIGWLTEDVELRSAIVGGASGSTYHGHDGVRQWAREVDEAFDELRMLPHDFSEVGDLVVGLGHVQARGGASGLVLDVPIGWVLSIRDGKVASLHGYLDHAEALAAARAAAN
jgi:ketosteroid isomerase-like protein